MLELKFMRENVEMLKENVKMLHPVFFFPDIALCRLSA